MKLQRIIVVMLLFFLVQSTIFYWLLPDSLVGRVVPRFTLALVLFAALYRDRHSATLLGLSFGLLQDLAFYGRIIGVHSFSMGLVGYLTGFMFKRRKSTMMMAVMTIALASLFYETVVYLIFRVFKLTSQSYQWALLDHILPSLFLQILFSLAIYIPARRWFEGSLKKKAEGEEE